MSDTPIRMGHTLMLAQQPYDPEAFVGRCACGWQTDEYLFDDTIELVELWQAHVLAVFGG